MTKIKCNIIYQYNDGFITVRNYIDEIYLLAFPDNNFKYFSIPYVRNLKLSSIVVLL